MPETTPENRASDVLIVGGGLAGLSAAAYAARAGASVTLFEKSTAPGGRGSTQERDGFLLNQGAHAFYRAGVGRQVLRNLGIDPPGGVPSPAGGFALARGVKHVFPGGFLSLLTTGLLSWVGKLEVARLLASLPRLDTDAYASESVADAVTKIAGREEVRELLLALLRLSSYSNDPTRQSAGDALAQLKLAVAENVIYFDGGWQSLVTSLRQTAEAAGATVVSGHKVERIGAVGGRIEAHLAGGRVQRAGAVVLATSPRDAAAVIDGPATATLTAWSNEAIPVLAACLDVCLERLPDPRARFALGIDHPIYLSAHSAVAQLAPKGRGLIQCMKYLGAEAPSDTSVARTELEAALDLMQPGWRELTIHQRYLPQMVVIHGLSTAAHGGAAGRPGPAVPGVDNVFVAGDWVGAEGMLADTSLASGRRAGELAASRRAATAAA